MRTCYNARPNAVGFLAAPLIFMVEQPTNPQFPLNTVLYLFYALIPGVTKGCLLEDKGAQNIHSLDGTKPMEKRIKHTQKKKYLLVLQSPPGASSEQPPRCRWREWRGHAGRERRRVAERRDRWLR